MTRRPFLLLALALACPTAASAATNSLREGAWGLEFQVQTPLFKSGNTGAAGIGAIKHFSDRSAVRLGMLVGLSSEDGGGTRTVERGFPYDTLYVPASLETYSDRRDVSLFLHLTQYVAVGTRLGLLVEAGPSARWISEEFGENATYRYESYGSPYEAISRVGDLDSWSYGGDLQAGFQWFFRSRLSVGGRYGFTAQRTESKQTQHHEYYNSYGDWERRSDETHEDGFTLQTTPAVLSLTAYF